METVVVNLRKEKFDVKITRNKFGRIPNPPEFGCFGNPFPVEQYGREKCIEYFKEYFLERISNDAEFQSAIMNLKGKRLGCLCKPENCHGDVIKEWLNSH